MKSPNRITISQSQRLALNGQLLTSLRILHLDASGLARFLQEQAEANPSLRLDWPAPREWLPRWQNVFAATAPSVEDLANAAPGLLDHVAQQLGTLRLTPGDRALAEALTLALEPSGWLGQPLEEVARSTGVPLPQAEALLARLQRLDPPGLFARSLAECLTVQAEEVGLLGPAMRRLLENLPLLAQGDAARIARALRLTEAEVAAQLRLLRGLDPKPGARFGALAAPVREPDLVVTRAPSGSWRIELNRSALPSLSLAEPPGEGRASAQALIRLVEGRNATLLKVGREILLRQAAALEGGQAHLVPLTMAAIAEALGLAQSTISRVVAGVAVDTPLGTWWLRGLFGTAVGTEGASGAQLRDRLSRLIRSEDPARPLSDAALAEAMAADGHALSRRTVAKYRDLLGLPPAHLRKRRAQMPGLHRKADRKGRPGG